MELSQGDIVYLSSIKPIMTDQEFDRSLVGKSENTTKDYMQKCKSLIVRGLLTIGKDRRNLSEHKQILSGTYHTENGKVIGRVFLLEKEDRATLKWQGPAKLHGENYRRIRDELAGPVPHRLHGRAAKSDRITIKRDLTKREPTQEGRLDPTHVDKNCLRLSFGEHPIWEEFEKRCKQCDRCKNENLLDPKAFPILMKDPPQKTDILFVLEAPNRDDTYNPEKQYLTIDPKTDQSGSFFYDLFKNELKFDIQRDLFVTNSVLCLPAKKKDGYPVRTRQRANCSGILRRTIDVFDPIIVCPLGCEALWALHIIEEHGYGRDVGNAVAKPTPWYGRILFPLYHTSLQVRNSGNRTDKEQRADWLALRGTWEKIKREGCIQEQKK